MALSGSGMGGLLGGLYHSKEPRVKFFVGNDGKHWWQLWFSSDIVCGSSQGYAKESEAKENFLKVESHIKWLREKGKV